MLIALLEDVVKKGQWTHLWTVSLLQLKSCPYGIPFENSIGKYQTAAVKKKTYSGMAYVNHFQSFWTEAEEMVPLLHQQQFVRDKCFSFREIKQNSVQ